jgi:hypothetical protein
LSFPCPIFKNGPSDTILRFAIGFASISTFAGNLSFCSFSTTEATTVIHFGSAGAFFRTLGNTCFAVFTCINRLIVRSMASADQVRTGYHKTAKVRREPNHH